MFKLTSRTHDKEAFSLVELMVSLVVVSCITAALTPVITKKLKSTSISVTAGSSNQNLEFKQDCSEDFSADCLLCNDLPKSGRLQDLRGAYVNAGIDELLRAFASATNRSAAMEEVCSFLQLHAPILPLCFKSTSVLMQTGVMEGLEPTMTEPFYNLTDCTIHLATP